MDPGTSAGTTLLGKFRFDRRGGGLFDLCSGARVAIGSRALDVLEVLIQHAGDLVLKDEILKAVWPRTTVDDSNLTVQIAALRRALDNDGSEGSVIQTVPGRGYRFVGSATANEPRPALLPPMPFENGHDPAGTPVASVRPMDLVVPSSVTLRRPRHGPQILLIAVLLLAGGVSFFWTEKLRSYSEAPAPPPRLSFVVLPFTNLSDDRDQQYFADGVTDDLTTDLTRISGSFVISRNTAFTYKDKAINAKQIGRELGVCYLLEGSVRRSGKQVVINAQLIDVQTGAHLWADRFEGDIADLFTVQNEIASRIAVALDRAIVRVEATRPTANPDAQDYIFRGRAIGIKPAPREPFAEKIDLFERALTLDVHSAGAQAYLATTLMNRALANIGETDAADYARAEDLVTQALAASPRSAIAHYAKGQLRRAQGRFAEAIGEYETVLSLDRNSTDALFALGIAKLFAGAIDETIPLEKQVIRLSPRDRLLGSVYAQIGRVHLMQSRTEDAIVWLEKAQGDVPGLPYIHAWLAAAYGLRGETERGAGALAEARRLGWSFRDIAHIRTSAATIGASPKYRELLEATMVPGLRKAGLPEE